jgi:hypothetical protein
MLARTMVPASIEFGGRATALPPMPGFLMSAIFAVSG